MSDPRWRRCLRQVRLRHRGGARQVVVPDSWLWLGGLPPIKGLTWIPYRKARWDELAPSALAVLYAAELQALGEEVLPILLRRWTPVWGDEACVLFSAGPGRGLDLRAPALRCLLRFSLQLKGLRQASCRYRSSAGLLFQCRDSAADIGAIEEAQAAYFDEILTPLPERPVVVDAGAHIGGFSVPAAKRRPKGRVFAFEPDPASFALLAENLRLNEAANVAAYPAGLAARRGKAPFFPCPANPVLSTAVARRGRPKIMAAFRAMPEFLEKEGLSQVDLLKVDIEGGEYELLMTRSASWLGKVRRFIIEAHGAGGYARLSRFLKARGLKVRRGSKGLLYAERR